MRVFLMGGTGLVGTRLIRRLLDRKDQVVLLTRRPEVAKQKWQDQCTIVTGNPMQPGAWQDAVADCDGVINLVGEGIFSRRWNAPFKELIRDSRIKSTQHVAEALAKSPRTAAGTAKMLVNASAIGFYGPHGDAALTEESAQGSESDFLTRLCIDWEKAVQAAETAGVRVVIVRVGVVLDKEGGALKTMLTPFKMFVGGPVGSGKQWISWIHHEDMVGLFLLGLDNAQATGPLNGTAPQPQTNKQFSNALGRALGRPSFLPMPRFMLHLMLGEAASVVTTGQRVLPKKALTLGYQFQFPEIDGTLRNLLG